MEAMNSATKYFWIIVFFLVAGRPHYAYSGNDSISYAYLLEEEKLAKDVYNTLGEKWNLQIFNNIVQSETHHIEMVKTILTNNNQPVKIYTETGKFYNPSLQELYDSLILKGMKSSKKALEVGLAIEIKDIADLEWLIKNSDAPSDIELLNLLLAASLRHKNAFTRNLNK